ncbi:MAG TPA: hypothetical protein VFN22_04445 [Gemmatimonadales bacterium]|nr:hypothetical protein [Gemmatimonadales bacterium]
MSASPVITVPRPVLAIQQRLEAAGFETWCVGGAVRDALLEIPQSDVDLATAATPVQVRDLFARTVPVGIAHGTVGVLDPEGVLHEVTTFRRDVTTDGRHAVVEFGVSLDDDLARRDFTINAIAWHPGRREFRDPFNGRADLEAGIVRAVGDPDARFAEDRLRILRAFRFAARFEFEIESATWEAAVRQAPDTMYLSAERVREEWWKGISRACDGLLLARLWEESGVAKVWLPADHTTICHHLDREPLAALASWRQPVEPILRRLKCSAVEIARGRAIDRGPAGPSDVTLLAARRWLAGVEPFANDLLRIHEMRTGVPAPWMAPVVATRLYGHPLHRSDLAVTGSDLIALGLPPGPAIGTMLDALLAHVIDDPDANDRHLLLDRAREALPE